MNSNSNSNTSKPQCPKPERLRQLIALLKASTPLDHSANAELTNALDWLATSLENRALYHKRQNLKKKIVFDLARERGLL